VVKMRISKTRFINDVRCNRFAALEEVYREKDKAVVAYSDDADFEDLLASENLAKTQAILDDMIDEEGNDLLVKRDEQLEIMMPYYQRIEIEAGKAIQSRFRGNVVYSMDTFKQKRFEIEIDGYRFYCFLDGFQEDDEVVRIFEVKATTSRKFLDIDYRASDRSRQSFFEYTPEEILMPRDQLGERVTDDYRKKVNKLKNRLTKEGRYLYDIAYQRFVIEKALKTTKRVCYYLAVLNADYIHDGAVDSNQDPIYGPNLIQFIDVTSLTEEMMPILEADTELVIDRFNKMNISKVPVGPHCQRKDVRQCKFYPICHENVPDYNSLFVYLHGHHGFKDESGRKHERYTLINNGVVHALDIPATWIHREDNIIQREVIETNKPYFKVDKIKKGIECLKYPIYHLDFETFPCPLPRFVGEKPYSQSLFQYSIHIEHAPGVCHKDEDNYSFLAKNHEDPRHELIKTMLDVIQDDGGSVMVYNQSFEQTRLKEMAELYPEFKERLEDLTERLFDLMHLLRGNQKMYVQLGYEEEEAKGINFYHNDLNGSFSIKKVLPIFTDLSYQNLGIGNGSEALVAYAKFPQLEGEAFTKIYEDLITYCKQDTWAMVEILEALRKIT
jgi:hypothetical protein